MASSPERLDSRKLAEVAELLRAEGCRSAAVYRNGAEVVIDGWAPSFEVKLRIHALVGSLLGYPVRNSVRVYPD